MAGIFYTFFLLFHDMEGNVHISEMSHHIIIGLEIVPFEVSPPHDIIMGVERQGDVETIAF